jgi:hypothetical protein
VVDSDPRRVPWSRLDRVLLCVSIAVPLLVAASRCSPFADAAHDEAVARTLGRSWTSVWRALDIPVSSLLLPLPFGTRALRAALVSAALGGLGGGLLFALARSLLGKSSGATPALVAAVAAASASLSGAWLLESSAAGSSLLGVVLILAPVVMMTLGPESHRLPLLAGMLGLALTYEPWVGLVACAGALPPVAVVLKAKGPTSWWSVVAAFAAGCLPGVLALAFCHRLDLGLLQGWRGDGDIGAAVPVALVTRELGWILAVSCILGAGLVLASRRKRIAGGVVVAVGVASAVAVAFGASAGKEHWSAPALTLVGAAAILAGVPMYESVAAVSRAKLPLASASAAMVLLFELTFPVLELDDALARLSSRAPSATRLWDDVAFEPLPYGSLVLVEDSRLYVRALAAAATGELRPDLTIVPTFDIGRDGAETALSNDPALYPLLRDLVLHGAPLERTLTSLASSRPIAIEMRPSYERGILRHVLPDGLLGSFYPEPRGASERLVGLETTAPLHDVFVPLTADRPFEPSVPLPSEGALGALTARLLDSRAKALAMLGEREAAMRTTGDSTSLELPSATGEKRARRLLTARGSRVAISP